MRDLCFQWWVGLNTEYYSSFYFVRNCSLVYKALHLVTVIVGRPSDTGTCRIVTCTPSSDLGESNEIEREVPCCPSSDEREKELSQKFLQVPKWTHYVLGVVALMNESGRVPGFDAVVASCVPLGGGLSSSASLEVATYLFIKELCRKNEVDLPVRSIQVCVGMRGLFTSVIFGPTNWLIMWCMTTTGGSAYMPEGGAHVCWCSLRNHGSVCVHDGQGEACSLHWLSVCALSCTSLSHLSFVSSSIIAKHQRASMRQWTFHLQLRIKA